MKILRGVLLFIVYAFIFSFFYAYIAKFVAWIFLFFIIIYRVATKKSRQTKYT
jgi:hypothetical protein